MPSRAGLDPPATPARLQLSVGNRLAALEPTRLAVREFLSPYRLSAEAIYGVELVLEEILVNAIAYAFPAGGEHSIALTIEVLPDTLQLRFEDRGVAFDPLHTRASAAPTAIGRAPLGGRGLLLVRKFARAADYRRSHDRNQLTITLARD
jgi:sigma-B regulation protein RsbU (phosphoserine phosphatase)